LLNTALVNHHNTVRHFQRLFLIVGDEHAGDMQLIMELAQPPPQILAYLRIKRTEGFI
jgi:hypothetical protein